MTLTRHPRFLLAAIAAVAAASVPGMQSALAGGASAQASCIGIEASELSPPGSSAEFPGGMPELIRVVRELAEALGVPPGAIVSSVSKLHEGSHAACDEATD